ncbi:PQQ-binding-like beta-propeller repeat protein [Actinomycetes bacterium KLBMP 9797]
MAEQDGGYALAVDLGTSNTVAVLRWPDGRTRPLLFDGQPTLPSAAYLDGAGRLHAGRDAQRLGRADPARYEPNPKRRVDESGVLLGDREVPTADLLAAVLGGVARAAVEAVGFLPPAVLTYPAAWGARRREVLATAVVRAGWPPTGVAHGGTRLVAEPVAAARYFADVLRRPVPVGAALAVFDFGGGTLDIAVVRNDGEPAGFTVIGSGGVAELGGLDLDAALVEHLGRLLAPAHPAAWRALEAPATAEQWRNRRQLWDEIRGAKEMLSRAAAAPVAVPGIEQAVHLTREELERAITPLLRRGVVEAGAVIGRCGLRPDQLAGLFLVGGSSRVPLVARLLHAELGIAPTVLEQPELPVAEGALTGLAASGPPSAPPAPPAPPAPVAPLGRKRPPRRPMIWLAAAVVALVGIVTAATLYITRDGYPAIDFESPVADLYQVDIEEEPTYAWTGFHGDHAYLAYATEDDHLEIIAIDPPATKPRWIQKSSATSERWGWITPLPDALLAYEYNASTSEYYHVYAFDPDTGDELWKNRITGADRTFAVEDTFVIADQTEHRLVGLDLDSGEQRWTLPNPGNKESAVYQARTVDDVSGPSNLYGTPFAQLTDDEPRLVQIGADRSARVIDAVTGKVLKTRGNVADPDDEVMAYHGRLIVGSDDQNGYRLSAYDLSSMGEPVNLYTSANADRKLDLIAMCGEQRLCLLDSVLAESESTEVVAVDLEKGGDLWHAPAPEADRLVHFGDQTVAYVDSSEGGIRVFDDKGEKLLDRPGAAGRIDGGNVLVFGSASEFLGDYSIAGLHAGSEKVVEMGQLYDIRPWSCSWNTVYLACAGKGQFTIGRFAPS